MIMPCQESELRSRRRKMKLGLGRGRNWGLKAAASLKTRGYPQVIFIMKTVQQQGRKTPQDGQGIRKRLSLSLPLDRKGPSTPHHAKAKTQVTTCSPAICSLEAS